LASTIVRKELLTAALAQRKDVARVEIKQIDGRQRILRARRREGRALRQRLERRAGDVRCFLPARA
jgi:hypothetical protein